MSEDQKIAAKPGAEGNGIDFDAFKIELLKDYQLCCESREASLLGRKEVLTGKAKFGIFGDGKEVAQVAMAKCFQNGDFRSGYYRDQTFMFASELATHQQFFAQLYADPRLEADPFSGGRQMNAHFATRSLDENGDWKILADQKNCAADLSPTGSQMARAVGLANASKYYRQNWGLGDFTQFSKEGNEVCFATIGDASTSEGLFWEAINAAGVSKIPLAVFVWDDGYGISVPRKYQTTKDSISKVLKGFEFDEDGGLRLYQAKAWDYAQMCQVFSEGIAAIRETHVPAVFHIQDCTQPQGHSTSGSHERYKSEERLAWEIEFDGIRKTREWILENGIAAEEELDSIEGEAKKKIRTAQKAAWKSFLVPIQNQLDRAMAHFEEVEAESANAEVVRAEKEKLKSALDPVRKDVVAATKEVLRATRSENISSRERLSSYLNELLDEAADQFSSHLYSQSTESAMHVEVVDPVYADDSKLINGSEIMNACFDAAFSRDPRLVAFGEDLGKIGDVNQGFAGLQEKHGESRIFDVGIREATIMGQGIGMAMRGLRPIAEIQYLDYLIYGLQPLTDDLATLQYRTKGGQKAPFIIRTRGHRLEGIWHTGSPMQMILGSLRGLYVLSPRNMTQAAGFYNTMLKSDEPALIIESLNGYRLKEKLPDNIGEFTVPVGVPEVLVEGTDLTLVTYGSSCRVAEQAVAQLSANNISVELIDVQSLLPFDIHDSIVESLKKTNRIIFLDEDFPGGTTSYMMQKVLEGQGGYFHLDSPPKTISAKAHRSPYGSDGDYFSKPNVEDVFDACYEMMHEVDPTAFPALY